MFAGSYSILARWRNIFSQLLNLNGAYDVRHIEVHTAETLVPEASAFDFEIVIEKLKKDTIHQVLTNSQQN